MGKIFCLMGKSSSGKDTIFKKIRDDKELNLSLLYHILQDLKELMKLMEWNTFL